MSDSDILSELRCILRLAVIDQTPISPARAERILSTIDPTLRALRTYTNGTSFSDQTVREVLADVPLRRKGTDMQQFWRCEHHPSALQNYQDEIEACVFGCHLNELRWWDNGCKPQTS
jgi:hypothetical protein